ncbi:MAG: ROK family transcriptional regulator [Clostridia bacterium]|nr:ROK family transcriptional regulator [Clostridia bacterium]
MKTSQNDVLRLIATGQASTRQDIAGKLCLSKATVSGICGELIRSGYLIEREEKDSSHSAGRRAVRLELHPAAPTCCGMLVRRRDLSVVLTELDGRLIAVSRCNFDSITPDRLTDELVERGRALIKRCGRRVLGVGIAALGPVDTQRRTIASPPDFYGIRDLPIADRAEEALELPAWFMHDTGAAAIAELLCKTMNGTESFIYLHVLDGIGASFVLNGKIYEGIRGNSGELGQMTLGLNAGRLEEYANIARVSGRIGELSERLYVKRSLPPIRPGEVYSWAQVLSACSDGDPAALTALCEFTDYVSCSLANTIILLNLDTVIVGCEGDGRLLCELLENRLNERLGGSVDIHVRVRPSQFRDGAPLIGAAAMISERLFRGEIQL